MKEAGKALQDGAHCHQSCWTQADFMSPREGAQDNGRQQPPDRVCTDTCAEVPPGTEAVVPEPELQALQSPPWVPAKRQKSFCNAYPAVHLVAPWYRPKSLLPLSATPDNEVQCICDLFCLLCILTEIHCPAAWVMYWQLNKGLHFCWLRVTSSSTSNQQSYISLAWLEIW